MAADSWQSRPGYGTQQRDAGHAGTDRVKVRLSVFVSIYIILTPLHVDTSSISLAMP